MPLTLSSFHDECRRQDVGLTREVTDTDVYQVENIDCYTPTPMLAAIAKAGTILRSEPDRQLAQNPLRIPRSWDEDVMAMTLATMVNDSIERVPTDYGMPRQAAKSVPTCVQAEPNTLQAIADVAYGAPRQKVAGLVVTDEAGAVFLRKASGYGQASAVALRQVAVRGVRYPAGSIMNLEGPWAPTPLRLGARPELATSWGKIATGQIRNAAFIRLSSLALPPAERGVFEETRLYNDQQQELHDWFTADDLRNSVDHALRQLWVTDDGTAALSA